MSEPSPHRGSEGISAEAKEIEELKEELARMKQREAERARREWDGRRQSVITYSREELMRSPEQATPVPARHVRGRLTMSPFHTPTSSQRHSPVDSAQKDNDAEGKEEETARLRRLNKLYKKLDTPPTFSGDESKDKITDVREWIDITDDYLRLHLEPSDLQRGGIIPFILVRTRGAAHDWLKTKMEEVNTLQRRGKLDSEMRWEELKNSFIEAFEGHECRVLKKLELESLRLGHGDCKTIVLLNAKFDQLSRRLYSSGTELAALDGVLADEYGKIIERSDINLWRDVHRMGIPTTLMQWKELAAHAWGSREIIRKKIEFHNNNKGPEEATWEPETSLISDGLQPLIDDYELEVNEEYH